MTDRYHGLDALRGFAMFLGIVLHVAISFMSKPLPFWPVWDDQRTPLAEVLLFAIHNFRMQLFFLLAGFFGALLYARYGWRTTTMHRLKRIALPLVLAMLTIQPLTQAIGVYAVIQEHRDDSENPNLIAAVNKLQAEGRAPWDATVAHFTTGRFITTLAPIHLWFLWYLLLFFALALPLALLADRGRSTAFAKRWDRAWGWLFASRGKWLILSVVTWALSLLMTGPVGPDTPLGWLPDPVLLAFYGFFVVVGWTLYRQRELLTAFVHSWRAALVVGHVLVLPVALVCMAISVVPGEFGVADGMPFRWLSQGAASVYCWTAIVGLTGLFLRYFAVERAWVRWGAESAYWCYLASLPPVVLGQFLVQHWPINPIVKFTGLTIVVTAVLLLSYQVAVRHTWIGRILNGPRRMERLTSPPDNRPIQTPSATVPSSP